MSGSILIPCDLSAKVILQTTSVSSLAGQPFANDAVLEPGVHLHWALPDALTGARIVNPDASSQALFPGVPDLWLVVRFNPFAKGAATRTWTAWVVDSRALTATPLANWQPPASPDPNTILTQAGVLKTADALGYPGWGSLPQSPGGYDVASAAYYPATRNRFGFFDNFVIPAGETVSYSVVGWYSLSQHDPLTMAADRLATLAGWNLTWDNDAVTTFPTQIVATAPIAQPAWGGVKIQSTPAPAPAAARVQQVKNAASLVNPDVLAEKITVMKDSFAVDPEAVIHAMEELAAPAGIVCHGSVVSVGGSSTSGAGIVPGSQIALHPSIKRALAAVANNGANDRTLDFSEMMLQSLESQSGTTGGVLDMPGAAQALSFQSAPGKSSFYATIAIGAADAVSISQAVAATGGNWPAIGARSAALSSARKKLVVKGQEESEPAAWTAQLLADLQTTVATAGKPVDPRFIYVNDTRAASQPVSLGVTPDGTGPDQAGYWLDTKDPNALALLYTNTRGADVGFPSPSTLHERPGPRWYRPWSPQIVLNGAGRTYRFGCDGRFDPGNQLVCRTTGNTVASISVNGSAALSGAPILASPAPPTTAGLPAEVAPLIAETLLLDLSNAPLWALQPKAPSEAQCNAALVAFYGSRNQNAPAGMKTMASGLFRPGQQPSPVAIALYADPFDPLFLDTKYTYLAQSVSDWQLQDDYVELTTSAPANDAGAQQFSERTRVTASLADVLTSTLITNRTLDSTGVLVTAQSPPAGVTAAQLGALNVISAPLVQFDETLFNAGWRARCGALRLDQLALVDVFGIRRSYPSPGDQSAAPANLVLTPRLPCWSRLNFRLRSAADPTKDADRANLPVCGFLVPDYLDHSLNVFDSTGAAIGQILSSPPQAGPGSPASLSVWFTPYPWISVSGDPTTAIADPTVRAFVQALIQNGAGVTEQSNGTTWLETGLTAMMRIIDTVRATLDPLAKTRDRRVKLVGDPIAIVRASVWIESVSDTDAGALAQSPTPVTVPPAMPAVPVRIGDITRPDDSVLGIFDMTNGKFAPVSMDAANSAVLSPLTMPNITNQPIIMPVTHPFIEPQHNMVVSGGAPLDLVILADVRGGYYATSGVLPRKKITMPQEFIQPAVSNIEPVFRVGPISTTLTNQGLIEPVMAPPKIEGLTAGFVHAVEDASQNTTYPSVPVPTQFPLGDLPTGTITIDNGFIRMSPDPPSV